MEVKVREGSKDKLAFEVYGADRTIMNLLVEKLRESKSVEYALFSVPHPLLDGFVVTVKATDAEKEVKSALKALKVDADELKAAFKKAK
jgi:DNA-directed RNA polymerase subunit L